MEIERMEEKKTHVNIARLIAKGRRKKISVNYAISWAMLLVTPLFCVNFMNRQWIFAAVFVFCGLVMLVLNAPFIKMGIKTILTLVCLVGFCICYYYMELNYNYVTFTTAIQRPVYIIASFIAGYCVTRVSQKVDFFKLLLLMVAAGHLLYVCLSLYRTYEIYGELNVKVFVSFWDIDTIIYGTNGTSPGNLAAAMSGCIFVPLVRQVKRQSRKHPNQALVRNRQRALVNEQAERDTAPIRLKGEKVIRVICLLVSITAISTSIMGGSRTGIVVAVAGIIVIQLYLWVFTKNGKNSMLMLAIAIITGLIIYSTNTFGLKDTLNDSFLFRRVEEIGVGEDSRVATWGRALKGIFAYPMGGRKTDLKGLFFAHNLWLDVGFKTGVVPFVMSITYFALLFFAFWEFKKNQKNELYISMVLCVFLAYTMSFFVEPVLDGYLSMFVSFGLLYGAMLGHNDRVKMGRTNVVV